MGPSSSFIFCLVQKLFQRPRSSLRHPTLFTSQKKKKRPRSSFLGLMHFPKPKGNALVLHTNTKKHKNCTFNLGNEVLQPRKWVVRFIYWVHMDPEVHHLSSQMVNSIKSISRNQILNHDLKKSFNRLRETNTWEYHSQLLVNDFTIRYERANRTSATGPHRI